MSETIENKTAIDKLRDVMQKLRDPDGGCPWDLEQTSKSIISYTIEEAYEVEDALLRGDMKEFKEELGDLLLQVIFHSQMASEEGLFDFNDVAQAIVDKMIRRHPHVFEDKNINSPDHVRLLWEDQKDLEKKNKPRESILDEIPVNFPAITRAQKIQKKAARVGFEWSRPERVLDKFEEEIAEMREALAGGREDEIIDELGDLFFVLTNFGRKLGVNCEEALRHANDKFSRRFRGIEQSLKDQNKEFKDTTLDEMEELWAAEKVKEKKQA